MQLRGDINTASEQPLGITDRDYLEYAIESIQDVLADEFAKIGLYEVEISSKNIESIVELLPNFSCFLLGRMTGLTDLHQELYNNEERVLPWVKNPENN